MNGYAPGNCTWYVKSKRPDIGSYWGNASHWLLAAQNDGYYLSPDPKVGAIGVQGNHVVYVESIEADMVNISEMNFNGGLYQVNYRTVPASRFTYIY